jgi:hypothetical protein
MGWMSIADWEDWVNEASAFVCVRVNGICGCDASGWRGTARPAGSWPRGRGRGSRAPAGRWIMVPFFPEN